MIKSKEFEIINISGEYMAVPLGKKAISFHGVVLLNEPAAILLNQMIQTRTKEELIDVLLEEYDADRVIIEKDVELIIKKFLEFGLICDC